MIVEPLAKDQNHLRTEGCGFRVGKGTPAAKVIRGRKAGEPVSRVLYLTRFPPKGPLAKAAAIPLGDALPRRSSDQPGLPGSETDPPERVRNAAPIRSCSGWGLPCRLPLPEARCALAAPFHPCLCPLKGHRRFALCGTFPELPLAFARVTRRALPATLVSWSPDFPRPRRSFVRSS